MRLSVEESLAMFLYICGHNERHRVVGHWFQHSTDTISKHFKRMRRALCTVAPIIIQPPNLDATPSEILNDARYYPYFEQLCVAAAAGFLNTCCTSNPAEVVASTDAAASAVLCILVTAAACSRNCYKCY
ncbi:hypothetical protein RHMOL_Rhmol13G0224900 [Rhododendron molle]|uniref:Uncharacterized protein n=1 Tax=Rhododendron molle TaxID=49168 RepID=A0ACC0LAK5_RHOML|nr:hypothetical protein RHMOL_Rhmol13G0224900 [Rhododendron molle]